MSPVSARLGLRLRIAPLGSRPCLAMPSTLPKSGFRSLRARAAAPLAPPLAARPFSLWGSSPKPTDTTSSTPSSEFATGTAEVAPPSPFTPNDTELSPAAGAPDLAPPVTNATSSADLLIASIPDANVAVSSTITNAGDLAAAGLVNWWPAGLTTWALENLHLATQLPWGHTLIAYIVATRLALFPLQVATLRNQIRMHFISPEMEKLSVEMRAAAASGNHAEMMRVRMAIKEVQTKNGVSMRATFVPAVATATVQIGMFLAVKRMCEAKLAPLTASGLSFLPDLTVAQPASAIAATTGILISLQLAKRDILKEQAGHMLNLLQVFSLFGFGFLYQLPAGVNLTIAAGSLFQIAQTALLQQPAVRRAFNIPVIPVAERPRQPRITELPDMFRQMNEDNVKKALAHKTAVEEARNRAGQQ